MFLNFTTRVPKDHSSLGIALFQLLIPLIGLYSMGAVAQQQNQQNRRVAEKADAQKLAAALCAMPSDLQSELLRTLPLAVEAEDLDGLKLIMEAGYTVQTENLPEGTVVKIQEGHRIILNAAAKDSERAEALKRTFRMFAQKRGHVAPDTYRAGGPMDNVAQEPLISEAQHTRRLENELKRYAPVI